MPNKTPKDDKRSGDNRRKEVSRRLVQEDLAGEEERRTAQSRRSGNVRRKVRSKPMEDR